MANAKPIFSHFATTCVEKQAIWYNNFGNRIRSTTDGMPTDFTYIRGNLLVGVDSNVLYKYNKDGTRFQKTVDGVVTKYFLDGQRIMDENRGTDTIRYFYDIDRRYYNPQTAGFLQPEVVKPNPYSIVEQQYYKPALNNPTGQAERLAPLLFLKPTD